MGGGGDDIARGVVRTPDKGFIVTGGSNSYNSNYDIMIVKTDSLGNQEWQKIFDSGYDDNSARIIHLSDNNYLLTTTYPSGASDRKGKLIKIDPLGDIIWQREYIYTGGYMSTYLTPVENDDGTMVTGGIAAPSGSYSRGYVLKVDPAGNKIWDREYYTRTDLPQYIYDIKPTADSGYVFCGSAFPDTSNLQRAWVVKLDCFGCDSLLCYYPDSACQWYDCTQYPIDAYFTSSADTIDIKDSTAFTFTNNSPNTTARLWDFGDGEVAYTSGTKQHTYTETGTYTVELTVWHGNCTDTYSKEITVINTTGIREGKNQEVKIKAVPNPSNGNVVIWYEFTEGMELTLYNSLGAKIRHYDVLKNSNSVDVKELDHGLYLVIVAKKGIPIGSERIIIIK